jgi:hypothetical protein
MNANYTMPRIRYRIVLILGRLAKASYLPRFGTKQELPSFEALYAF